MKITATAGISLSPFIKQSPDIEAVLIGRVTVASNKKIQNKKL